MSRLPVCFLAGQAIAWPLVTHEYTNRGQPTGRLAPDQLLFVEFSVDPDVFVVDRLLVDSDARRPDQFPWAEAAWQAADMARQNRAGNV